jgi:hypothetical protein
VTDAERTAAHEAGHACACVVLGVPVRLVDVAGDAEALGRVRHGLEQVSTPEDAHKRMLIILAGQIEGADHWDDVPSWPLQPNASTDEYNLDALAEYLGLDEKGYRQIAREALELTCSPDYYMLHQAVSGMLGYFPRIGPQMIARLDRLTREARWNT